MLKYFWPVAALIALTACDSNSNVRIVNSDNDDTNALKVISALQCPTDQGPLVRRGSASDEGRTCVYTGPRGAEVKLHLVALNGTPPSEALQRFEDEVIPEGTKSARTSATYSETTGNEDEASAQVTMPGLKVESKGDRSTVRLPGMKIETDGDRSNIRIGGLVIHADDQGSQISHSSRADQTTTITTSASSDRRGASDTVRANLMHVAPRANADGWRVVGYEARGPAGGPIVVATFRLRDRDSGDVLEAAKALVSLNVGD